MTYLRAKIADDGNIESSWLRLIAGNCPRCGEVVAVFNHGQTWPLVKCPCGWAGDTHAPLNKVRFERIAVEAAS